MIICVYRTCYGLQHQYHTKNAQNRTPPQHLAQFTPPAVAGKKRTAILFTVARARFKCVFFIVNKTCHIARRRSESVMKTVNWIIAHVTNYVICAYIFCKKMTQFRVNILRPFVSQGNHFDVALSSSGNKFRYVLPVFAVFALIFWLSTWNLMLFVTFFREILMPKLYDQNQNLADVVNILRDAIATLHQPNPGPVLTHCSLCIVVRSIH